ncbi:helix-turn-helix domain-containing protein [Photobacterium damselae subsp. damselae]|uniref:helix-turn-helix domain-containing protein n=1 Tax=Photobacterium damselae TaxID=38293 RepID=UPI001F42FE11|nr:helix-turn-helix transcriptional regulator [Photobacterium damselae]UKA23358.1 helix-turn-helix domain-containing protein [Photobacterium damselae subsp. damselae]
MHQLETLSQRLKWARKRAKLSQGKLAKLVNIEQSIISKLENNLLKSTNKIVEIANELSVSVYWLKTGNGDPDVVIPVSNFNQLELAVRKFGLSDEEILIVEKYAIEKSHRNFLVKIIRKNQILIRKPMDN